MMFWEHDAVYDARPKPSLNFIPPPHLIDSESVYFAHCVGSDAELLDGDPLQWVDRSQSDVDQLGGVQARLAPAQVRQIQVERLHPPHQERERLAVEVSRVGRQRCGVVRVHDYFTDS